MLGKPYCWRYMDQESRDWCRGVDKRNLRAKVVEVVDKGSIDRLQYILEKFDVSRDVLAQAMRQAIAKDAGSTVNFLLGWDGRMFGSSAYAERLLMADFIDVAAKARAVQSFQFLDGRAILAAKACPSETLSRGDVAAILLRASWLEPVEKILTQADITNKPLFAACLNAAVGLPPENTEVLDFVLAWSGKFVGSGEAIDQALVTAAGGGDLAKARILLSKGANPNADGGQGMLCALQAGQEGVAELLLDQGFDRERYGADVLKRLGGRTISERLREKILDKGQAEPAVAEMPDPETLCERSVFSDGLKLTTIFNFRTQQQIVISERPGQKTPAMSMSVQNFADMRDKTVISAAARRLAALGGQPDAPSKEAPRLRIS